MKSLKIVFQVAALLAGSACRGGGSIELDAIGSLSMAEDDLTVRVAAVADKYDDRPLAFVSDPNGQSFRDGLLPVHIDAGKPLCRILDGTIGITASDKDSAALNGDFASVDGVELTGGIGIVVTFPAESWNGAEWRTDGGSSGTMPGTFSKSPPLGGKGRRVEFARKDGRKVAFEFPDMITIVPMPPVLRMTATDQRLTTKPDAIGTIPVPRFVLCSRPTCNGSGPKSATTVSVMTTARVSTTRTSTNTILLPRLISP